MICKNYKKLIGCLITITAFLCFAVAVATAQDSTDRSDSTTSALQEPTRNHQFRPVRTDSPRQTFETFLYLKSELDQIALEAGLDTASDDRAVYERTLLIIDQSRNLIDLSSLAEGSRDEVGSTTVTYLIDIFGRIELPKIESIPDAQEAEIVSFWRVPGTPIRIGSISDGPRRGEYLFDADTYRDAPRFYRGIAAMPLRPDAVIESWTQSLPQITGPMIPARVVRGIPAPFKRLWLGTPVWKIMTVVLLVTILSVLVLLFYWLLGHNKAHSLAGIMTRNAGTPLVILLILWQLEPLIAYELNVSGAFWAMVGTMLDAVTYISVAWMFWWLTQAFFEWLIQLRYSNREEIDNPLLLITGKSLAIIGTVMILAAGAQAVGLPVYSIVAGLGIGGLAVALSVRPTLENLIGGVLLYLDNPVSVGDYCSFGDKTGTIEQIGIRTTKIRGLDRTLITVPNSTFADMELINWAHCDKMLISATIGIRHETQPDQLRYLLIKMREMFHAHPKIDNETVRVRLTGFGSSALEVSVRVYALTAEWNNYFAIREDVFLRTKDILVEAGIDFALPSQTLYMTRDSSPNKDLAEAAASEVESLRRSGRLPFPCFSSSKMAELEDTLDWPPYGSWDRELEDPAVPEPLATSTEEEKGDGKSKKKAPDSPA